MTDKALSVVWALIFVTLTLDMVVFVVSCKNGVRDDTMEACKKTCAPRVVKQCTDEQCECEAPDEPRVPR